MCEMSDQGSWYRTHKAFVCLSTCQTAPGRQICIVLSLTSRDTTCPTARYTSMQMHKMFSKMTAPPATKPFRPNKPKVKNQEPIAKSQKLRVKSKEFGTKKEEKVWDQCTVRELFLASFIIYPFLCSCPPFSFRFLFWRAPVVNMCPCLFVVSSFCSFLSSFIVF